MKKIITLATLLVLPLVTSAQQLTNTDNLLNSMLKLVRTATILIAGIALLVFFFGLMKFIFKIGGDAKAAAEGRQLMIWGTIALFVMVSIWGIVHFLGGEILGQGNQYIPAPQIPVFNQ